MICGQKLSELNPQQWLEIIQLENYFSTISRKEASQWTAICQQALLDNLQNKHGNYLQWLELCLQNINTDMQLQNFSVSDGTVCIGEQKNINQIQKDNIYQQLMSLKPWRKGPFELFAIEIDCEWRSNLKWDRLKNKIDVRGKQILDVGCANGYFGYRLLESGACRVLGIDPGWLFHAQFLMFKKFLPQLPLFHFPITMEQLPQNMNYFDTVLSMGVLYHRRSPFEHLFQLKQALCKGGQLVLETLVVDGPEHYCLVPQDRYAKMRNVWFIPSVPTLILWLKRCGFVDIEVVCCEKTTAKEQRKTDWMDQESLDDFLMKDNPQKTIEAYPAPMRVVVLASK